MKQLRNALDNLRPHFSEGGRLHRLEPLFGALETVFFIPVIPTRQSPLVRDSLDVKRFMSIVILALLPVTLFGILNAGYQAAVASGRSLSWAQIFIEG
ncbi:MAG: NADH:ubiquinone reductase (Na(+)-transporting) subunit B, partial [Desulfobacterales bacterium]|nr:NADH:ubiquinone reductase (Na(+)-transporting) subunit B [Desulfobacterales bacterium]